jgi:nicotinate-nucleotide pyrophosphorylase (carboxylating)
VSVYSAPWYTPSVQRLLDLALEEDVGRGDVTSASVIDETQEGEAEIVARERGVVCGLGVVEAVFTRFDWRMRVRAKVADGDPVAKGTVVASVRGPAAALLAGERTALNFLQHLSGIATLTQAFVAAAEGAKLRVTDTRKTTPGGRALEKYAVRVGGGANHRFDLASGVLIKDNHIALVGSVREAVRRARAGAPHGLRVAVEVDDAAQLDEALEAGAEVILLDNFQTREMAEAVKRIRERAPRTIIEASGGVTLDRMREISKTGVDVVSIGAITHSARAIDYSCEIRPVEGPRGNDRGGTDRGGSERDHKSQ